MKESETNGGVEQQSMSHCEWCDEEAEEIALELSIFDRQTDSKLHEADHQPGESRFCDGCVERLAQRRRLLQQEIFSSSVDDSADDLAFSMIRIIDILNSEPPNRDWEDTFPSDS